MSNPYYTFTPAFVPGEKVRAGRVNNQFTLIEDAFDLLPTSSSSLPLGTATLGVESGSGNAYAVTMPNTRTVNAAGDEVVFKATHQNSGASTLQVDAIPAVGLKRYNGDPLQSGDVLVDAYYVARYDATNGYFRIVSPALQTNVGTISYATPTGQVKLAASAGAATTVIRSDANIALDQSITPTWSGQHTFSQPLLGPAGTALLPAYSYSGDPNTGAYNVGADDWGVATGGTLRFDISTTAITSTLQQLGTAGSATSPTYSYSGDPNTGAYSVGADDWGIATGGVLRFDISTTAITSTLHQLGTAGSATSPTYSYSGDSNTGAYSVGADDWGVATGGTLRFDISTTAITSTLVYLNASGSVSAPSYAFSADSNSGIYSISDGNIGVSTNGAFAGGFNGSQQFIHADGAAGTPAMSFANDADTGWYHFGTNSIGGAAGGTAVLQLDKPTGNASRMIMGFAGATTDYTTLRLYNDQNLGTRALEIDYSGSAYASSLVTNSPTGEQAAIGTTGAFPLTLFTSNTAAITIDSNRLARFVDGTAGAPALTWINDTNTGIYRDGSDSISFGIGGSQLYQFNATVAQFLSSTAGYYLAIGNTSIGFLEIGDNVTAPSAPATGRARIYIDAADGDLKIRFGDGTIKTIVVDT